MKSFLNLTPAATVAADPRMCNASVKKLWRSFFLGKGNLSLKPSNKNTFRLGSTPLPTLPEGKETAPPSQAGTTAGSCGVSCLC